MRIAMIAAVLAAALPLAPLAARESQGASAPIALRDHIRTTLHGEHGPVVVLIPGMSTPGAAWDETVARLSDDHRLLVVEVRGFDGERGSANERFGVIDGVVREISADLAARSLGPVAIAGHSFGGLVAMKFALAHPEQAERVLVVDALPFFGTVLGPGMTLEQSVARGEQMRATMVSHAEAMRAAGAKGVEKAPVGAMALGQDHATQIANWSLRAEPLAVGQALYEDLAMDLRMDIAALAMPVTVLYQAHQNPEAARLRYEADYAALPGARLVPVDRTSHFIMLDRPDAFDAELAVLLAR